MKRNDGLDDEWMYSMYRNLLAGTDEEVKANILIHNYHFLKKKKFKELLRFIFIIFMVVMIISASVFLFIYAGIPHYIRVVLNFVCGSIGGLFISIEQRDYISTVDFINQQIEGTEYAFDSLIRKAYQKDQYDKCNLFCNASDSINTKTEKGN